MKKDEEKNKENRKLIKTVMKNKRKWNKKKTEKGRKPDQTSAASELSIPRERWRWRNGPAKYLRKRENPLGERSCRLAINET